jgi:hypothetical protein
MESKEIRGRKDERGIALITSLLASTMLLALGMTVVLSATNSTAVTMGQRTNEQAFLTADAGIAIARKCLAQALDEQLVNVANGTASFFSNSSSNPKVFPDMNADANWQTWYQAHVLNRAIQLAQDSTRLQKFSDLNGSKYKVTFSVTGSNASVLNPAPNQFVQALVVGYRTQVTGTARSGSTATLTENGNVSSTINMANAPNDGTRNFSFSGFSVFFDSGDPILWAVLCPGTYSGPVHTNTDFCFYAYWQYNFRNQVTQVNPNIRYWDGNGPNNWIPIPNQSIQGISLSSQGYHQAGSVPLPSNNFSQEYAVINGTGITATTTGGSPVDPPPVTLDSSGNPITIFDSTGRVTAAALAANLRNTSNSTPTLQSGALPQGVYIASSNGTSVTGAGLYIQGDTTDFKLYSDTSVDPDPKNADQVYVITQGSTTTTVRLSYKNSTTSVTNNSGTTTTYTGLPTDRSNPSSPQTGAVVFANGSIWSLRGGTDGSQNVPAIASRTHMTIASSRHIKLTGDIKYTDPVVNPDGTPVANIGDTNADGSLKIQNVLGLFTNDGNIYLDAKPAYVSNPDLSIQMNGAFCVFNSNTADDNGNAEGGITTWFGSGHITPNWTAAITLIGSDVESLNSLVDYYNCNEYYDFRFAGGNFRPPFFPGTNYTLGSTPGTDLAITNFDYPFATAMTWYRTNN